MVVLVTTVLVLVVLAMVVLAMVMLAMIVLAMVMVMFILVGLPPWCHRTATRCAWRAAALLTGGACLVAIQ